jgi:RNA polymerase sigma-70 factor, ECF subfamily
VRADRPRFQPAPEVEQKLFAAFAAAMYTGDVEALAELLAEDAVLYSDGGGVRHAALNPIAGRDRITRFAAGILRKRGPPGPGAASAARINGLPGFVLRDADGLETLAIEVRGDRIAAIYMVRNPNKLRHLH